MPMVDTLPVIVLFVSSLKVDQSVPTTVSMLSKTRVFDLWITKSGWHIP